MANPTIRNCSAALALALAFNATPSWALPSDAEQPVDVAADTAELHDAKGLTILKGNVVIIQGSMEIRAAQVDITRSNGEISKMVAVGSPAHFRQQHQADQPFTDAYGQRMVYLIGDQTVTITGDAKVHQLNDRFTGSKIVYQMDKAVVNAFGGGNGQRVKMVIQPKSK